MPIVVATASAQQIRVNRPIASPVRGCSGDFEGYSLHAMTTRRRKHFYRKNALKRKRGGTGPPVPTPYLQKKEVLNK